MRTPGLYSTSVPGCGILCKVMRPRGWSLMHVPESAGVLCEDTTGCDAKMVYLYTPTTPDQHTTKQLDTIRETL